MFQNGTGYYDGPVGVTEWSVYDVEILKAILVHKSSYFLSHFHTTVVFLPVVTSPMPSPSLKWVLTGFTVTTEVNIWMVWELLWFFMILLPLINTMKKSPSPWMIGIMINRKLVSLPLWTSITPLVLNLFPVRAIINRIAWSGVIPAFYSTLVFYRIRSDQQQRQHDLQLCAWKDLPCSSHQHVRFGHVHLLYWQSHHGRHWSWGCMYFWAKVSRPWMEFADETDLKYFFFPYRFIHSERPLTISSWPLLSATLYLSPPRTILAWTTSCMLTWILTCLIPFPMISTWVSRLAV